MSYDVIKSDDPQALEKLSAKLEECRKSQEFMKGCNAYYKKNGTVKGYADISDEQALKIDTFLKSDRAMFDSPYPPYKISNNNQEIHRLQKRIESLTHNKAVGFVGWKFQGGEAVANENNCRLQLRFDKKPSDVQRNELKRNGFRWAPSEGAWQRQLNSNAIYACDRIDFIKPLDGKRPTDLQPKAPKKEEIER